MANKPAKPKLDGNGFIFPLAVGVLALIFFTWYFLTMSSKSSNPVVGNSIKSIDDLNAASKDLDNQNPDAFTTDLNSNANDAANF